MMRLQPCIRRESWETLQHAYDDAKVILENYRDGYTQAETDAAEAALAAAMEQMQPAQEEIPKTGGKSISGGIAGTRELCDAGGDTGTNAGPGAGGDRDGFRGTGTGDDRTADRVTKQIIKGGKHEKQKLTV